MKGLRNLLSKEWADCVFHNLPISLGKAEMSLQGEKEFSNKDKITIKSLYEISKKSDFSNPYDFLRSD